MANADDIVSAIKEMHAALNTLLVGVNTLLAHIADNSDKELVLSQSRGSRGAPSPEAAADEEIKYNPFKHADGVTPWNSVKSKGGESHVGETMGEMLKCASNAYIEAFAAGKRYKANKPGNNFAKRDLAAAALCDGELANRKVTQSKGQQEAPKDGDIPF